VEQPGVGEVQVDHAIARQGAEALVPAQEGHQFEGDEAHGEKLLCFVPMLAHGPIFLNSGTIGTLASLQMEEASV
jgi:hypothetical protein